jgi:hypothetical protein
MSETRHPENPFGGVPANADPEPGGWGWQVVPHSDGTAEPQPEAQRVTSGWEVVTSENKEVGKRRPLVTGAQLKRAAKLVFFSIIWIALIAMLLGVLLAIISKFA